MKRTKIAALVLAIVMLVSVMSVGFGASAADVQYAASTTQSSMSNVSLSGDTITGSFSLWGYANTLKVIVGNQLSSGASASGTVVYSETGDYNKWPIATSCNFTAKLSDGGKSTTGYTVIATDGNAWAGAYIPYTGPTYLMEIRRNGAVISNLDLGINEGTATGFSFVYENGGSYTYNVSDESVIAFTKSGDTFSIAPKKIGTATITATCNGVSSTTLTVNVVDDSTLTAQWYDTGAVITNNASFSGQATVTYGFGVEAFPDNYNVTLSNNTANATYSSSTVQGQYPNSIVAANEGSVKVTIAGATKSIAFTVNFTAAPEPVFGFYTDAACKNEAEPMVAIEAGKTATIYANEAVASWAVEGTGASKSASTSTSITIAASTVDSLVTVRAYAADGTELGWFDVYVTSGSAPIEPEADVFVFKIDDPNIYYANDDVKFVAGTAPFMQDGKAIVPLRSIASAAGISDLKYDAATKKITFTGFDGYKVEMQSGSTKCTLIKGAEEINIDIVAPFTKDGSAMLPLRDTTNLVGGYVKYSDHYIVVSKDVIDDADVAGYIAAYDAK